MFSNVPNYSSFIQCTVQVFFFSVFLFKFYTTERAGGSRCNLIQFSIKTTNSIYEQSCVFTPHAHLSLLRDTCRRKTHIILPLTRHDTCYNCSALCIKCQEGL